MPEHTMTVEFELNDGEVLDYEVTFDFYAYSIPAKLHGKPEDCYPADFDSDWNITNVVSNGKQIPWNKLREDVKYHIKVTVDEWVDEEGEEATEEDNFDPPDDYDDYDDLPDHFIPANYDPYGGP